MGTFGFTVFATLARATRACSAVNVTPALNPNRTSSKTGVTNALLPLRSASKYTPSAGTLTMKKS